MHPAYFVVVAGILAQASLYIFCCPLKLVMKRKAEDELKDGEHRAEKSVNTEGRPAYYRCVHCGQYKPDVAYKPVSLQYVNPVTQESVGWPWWTQWNLCDECYGQVPHPVRLNYLPYIEGDGCVK